MSGQARPYMIPIGGVPCHHRASWCDCHTHRRDQEPRGLRASARRRHTHKPLPTHPPPTPTRRDQEPRGLRARARRRLARAAELWPRAPNVSAHTSRTHAHARTHARTHTRPIQVVTCTHACTRASDAYRFICDLGTRKRPRTAAPGRFWPRRYTKV
jgi:hypothetical protein